jgi:hypothetical protein
MKQKKFKMNLGDSKKRGSSVFDSTDFQAFFPSVETRSISSVFKSKDFLANLFQSNDSISDIFKSSFSSMYASRDWSKNYAPTRKTSSADSSDEEDDDVLKTFLNTSKSMTEHQKVVAVPETATSHSEVMKSQEWVVNKTLGVHVEIPYSKAIFSTDTSFTESENERPPRLLSPANLPPIETQWNELFMSQLKPPTASPVATQTSSLLCQDETVSQETISDAKDLVVHHSVCHVALNKQGSAVTALRSGTGKKKRKRTPRKKVVPEKKEYVEPMPLDILSGRGGKSNHHHGNKRYREEVENLKEWYNNIDSKDSKTDLSQCLVDYVQSYGARFLEQDDHGWYIVDNITARRKASQALRENTDPDKRRAKRQRFLAKRAQGEGGRCNQQQYHG